MDSSRIRTALLDILKCTAIEIESVKARLIELEKYQSNLIPSLFQSVLDTISVSEKRLYEHKITDSKSSLDYALDIREAILSIRNNIMLTEQTDLIIEKLEKLNILTESIVNCEDEEPISKDKMIEPFTELALEPIKDNATDNLSCTVFVLTQVANDAEFIIDSSNMMNIHPTSNVVYMESNPTYVAVKKRLDMTRADLGRLRTAPEASPDELRALEEAIPKLESALENLVTVEKIKIEQKNAKLAIIRTTFNNFERIAKAYLFSPAIMHTELALIAKKHNLSSILELYDEYLNARYNGNNERVAEISTLTKSIVAELCNMLGEDNDPGHQASEFDVCIIT